MVQVTVLKDFIKYADIAFLSVLIYCCVPRFSVRDIDSTQLSRWRYILLKLDLHSVNLHHWVIRQNQMLFDSCYCNGITPSAPPIDWDDVNVFRLMLSKVSSVVGRLRISSTSCSGGSIGSLRISVDTTSVLFVIDGLFSTRSYWQASVIYQKNTFMLFYQGKNICYAFTNGFRMCW